MAPFRTAEILCVGEDDDLPYVVTEFIDGPSLRVLVEEEGAPLYSATYGDWGNTGTITRSY